MKKKFLSLMMAAAVVATTSVSAFAADSSVETPTTPNVTTQDDKDGSADVTITGNIADEQGNMPAASFKVTVPTAASFTVTKNGFYGPKLEVKNAGSQEIEVYAQSFTRVDEGSGEIKTVKEQDIKTNNRLSRANVSLKLEGQRFEGKKEDSVAYLSVANGGNGVYTKNTLSADDVAEADGVKLLVLGAGNVTEQKDNIILKGSAGQGAVNKAIDDKFQLTLKIKKVTKVAEVTEGNQDAEENRDQ